MSARVLGWQLMCDGCGARYTAEIDAPLSQIRGLAAGIGWWADDEDIKPEYRRDFCPSCKVRNRVRAE